MAVVLAIELGAVVGVGAGAATYKALAPDREYVPLTDQAYANLGMDAKSDPYYQRRRGAEVRSVVVGVIGGLALFNAVVWLGLRIWSKAKVRAERDLAAKIETTRAEFPQKCKARGGLPVLRDPEAVQDWIRALEASR